MSIKDIQKQFAEEHGYKSWRSFRNDYPTLSDELWEQIAERYAKQPQLQKADVIRGASPEPLPPIQLLTIVEEAQDEIARLHYGFTPEGSAGQPNVYYNKLNQVRKFLRGIAH